MHKWTKEHLDYLREIAPGRLNHEITDLFNKRFKTSLKASTIKAARGNHFIQSGVVTRFDKGHTPANKGTKGVSQPNRTSFKKGQKPHNYMPIGTVKVKGDGYVWVKIADPNIWKQSHILLWERENGPVPKGSCLLFKNGDRTDVRLENLMLISRNELSTLNKKSLITNDADLTVAQVGLVRLSRTIKQVVEGDGK